jgi:uncharacterized protein (TIGR03435 family)
MLRPGQLGPTLARRENPCPPPPDRTCQGTFESLPGGGQHLTRHGSLSQLLMTLQLNNPDRLVVDETGLEGEFDWELVSGPAPAAVGRLLTPEGRPVAPSSHPVLHDAIEEQLGLQLVPTEVEVDVVVIDAVSMPTAN